MDTAPSLYMRDHRLVGRWCGRDHPERATTDYRLKDIVYRTSVYFITSHTLTQAIQCCAFAARYCRLAAHRRRLAARRCLLAARRRRPAARRRRPTDRPAAGRRRLSRLATRRQRDLT